MCGKYFHLPHVPSQQAEALILFTFGHSIGGGTRKRSVKDGFLLWCREKEE